MRTRRRDFLKSAGLGLAAGGAGLYRPLALAAEMQRRASAGAASLEPSGAGQAADLRLSHRRLLARRYVRSQAAVEDRRRARASRPFILRGTDVLPLMASPFRFSHHGESGLPISELFPHLGTRGRRAVRGAEPAHRHHRALSVGAGDAHRFGDRAAAEHRRLGQLRTGDAQRESALVRRPVRASALRRLAGLGQQLSAPRASRSADFPGRPSDSRFGLAAPTLSLHELEQRMLRDANELHAAARPDDLNLRRGRRASTSLAA